MTNPTREEIRAQIKESEANSEIKIVRLEGKIDALTATLIGKIDSLEKAVTRADDYNHGTRWVLFRCYIVASVLATIGALIALATYGDALFGRGMNVRDVVQAVIKEQQELQKKEAVSPSLSSPAPRSGTGTGHP